MVGIFWKGWIFINSTKIPFLLEFTVVFYRTTTNVNDKSKRELVNKGNRKSELSGKVQSVKCKKTLTIIAPLKAIKSHCMGYSDHVSFGGYWVKSWVLTVIDYPIYWLYNITLDDLSFNRVRPEGKDTNSKPDCRNHF